MVLFRISQSCNRHLRDLASWSLTCLVLWTSSPALLAQQEARSLEPEDLFAIKTVGSPVISPNGERVAYTVRETSLEDNSSETRVWMASVDGELVLPMTAAGSSAGSPAWSPDGRYLSFLAARNDGETQVWAMNTLGGEAKALTAIEQGVSDYAWSPNGEYLALLITDAEDTATFDPLQDNMEDSEDDEDESQPWVIDRLQFKRDYTGYLNRKRDHIHLFDLASEDKSATTQLTFGDFEDGGMVWSPDSSRIAFVSNRTAEPDSNSNSDIWVVEVNDPDAGLTQVTSNPGSDYGPSWSPDGNWIAYSSVTAPEIIWYATSHLAVSPAGGGQARVLTQRLDRNISSAHFASNSEDIYFILEDSGERHLASIDRTGEDFQRHIEGQLSVRGVSINGDDEIATLIGQAQQPAEVFTGSGAELRQLSQVNRDWLDEVQLAEVENVQFESEAGVEIEGFIYKPPGFQQGVRYPTLLRIHGGPVSQYDFNFNFEAQLFAASGYVVVMTNPRGSSGYGQDFSYELWADWGNPDFKDVMAGVDHAIDLGYSDPDRLGVGGWSYGGILTNYVITQTDRFSGAITGASEVLYRSNYGHDHYQRQWEAELGLPWENAAAWERISPFNKVANITTPTLIMGGEHDWNVPILNSEQLYQALKRRGIETLLVVYPDEHHGIRKPSFQLDRLQRYVDWYDRYVK